MVYYLEQPVGKENKRILRSNLSLQYQKNMWVPTVILSATKDGLFDMTNRPLLGLRYHFPFSIAQSRNEWTNPMNRSIC